MGEKTYNGLTLSELDEFAIGLHDRLALDQEDGACLADSYVLARAVLELIPEVKLLQHERDICRAQLKLLRAAASGAAS